MRLLRGLFFVGLARVPQEHNPGLDAGIKESERKKEPFAHLGGVQERLEGQVRNHDEGSRRSAQVGLHSVRGVQLEGNGKLARSVPRSHAGSDEQNIVR